MASGGNAALIVTLTRNINRKTGLKRPQISRPFSYFLIIGTVVLITPCPRKNKPNVFVISFPELGRF